MAVSLIKHSPNVVYDFGQTQIGSLTDDRLKTMIASQTEPAMFSGYGSMGWSIILFFRDASQTGYANIVQIGMTGIKVLHTDNLTSGTWSEKVIS